MLALQVAAYRRNVAAGSELAAYLCRNFTCTLLARSVEALGTELQRSGLLQPTAQSTEMRELD